MSPSGGDLLLWLITAHVRSACRRRPQVSPGGAVSPPLNDPFGYERSSTTFVDAGFYDGVGAALARPYRYTPIPVAIFDHVSDLDIYVSISNLPSGQPLPDGYQLMATCRKASDGTWPCPRPLGPGSPECSGHGTCYQTGLQDMMAGAFCKCDPGYADSGCDVQLADALVTAIGAAPPPPPLELEVPAGEARYLVLDVPTSSYDVEYLVEMDILNAVVSDPVLLVRPRTVVDHPTLGTDWLHPARLPIYNERELRRYGDEPSWFTLKGRQWVAGFVAQSSPERTVVVAVYNPPARRQDLGPAALPAAAARVRLTALLAELPAGIWSDSGYVCPQDCNGRGTCVNPAASGGTTCYCDPGKSKHACLRPRVRTLYCAH